jgi:hypothetical protein
MHRKPFLPHRGSNQWSLDDLEVMFVVIALMLFPSGAFLFLRRGFWWLREHREEIGITEIDLK